MGASDKGVYTCNLHHHYCQIHQSIQIKLNVTKSGEENQPDHLTQLFLDEAKSSCVDLLLEPTFGMWQPAVQLK